MPISRHVLLADDDPIFLASMAAALRQHYRVTTAEHFSVSLGVLESTDKPDILITDIVMPQSINGLALARMARVRHPSIAVIFLTGFDMPELEQMAFGPVLRKPIEPVQLIAAIDAECATRAEATSPSPPPPAATPDAA